MYEVVAMVKQLGVPTWFMTLSCADLRWPEELDALSYNKRCQILNTNPVIVAKHFQYRVETFFSEVLLNKQSESNWQNSLLCITYRISDERFSPFTCINLDFRLS